MAKLNELKLRTENSTAEELSDIEYLLYTNEVLEELSEIAKVEALPSIDIKLEDGTEYIILNDNTRLTRKTIDGELIYFDEDGKKLETEDEPLTDDIKEALKIRSDGIDLPTNFMQIIKVEAFRLDGSNAYIFRERGFGDDVITTGNRNVPRYKSNSTESNLFFISKEESRITFRSSLLRNNNLLFSITYYKHLPLFDINNDVGKLDQLTPPIEPTYHNLINYYACKKYFEGWQDADKVILYKAQYNELRAQYESSVLRKHAQNQATEVLIELPWY